MRALVPLLMTAALVACDKQVDLGSTEILRTAHFDQPISSSIDLLFVVDDSSSMREAQQNLVHNFPRLMNVLEALPEGLPDLHIGVVTSNMGAGAFTTAGIQGCTTPDDGRLIYRRRATTAPAPANLCQTAKLRDATPGNPFHFIETLGSGSSVNFDGSLADVFRCIAEVGSNGCGFEQPLAAAKAALAPGNDWNAGFLRDDALLAVIFITNEDDCSVPIDSQLFDPNQITTHDHLGPVSSFRCAEFGIVCNGVPPPRFASNPLSGCVSNDHPSTLEIEHGHTLVPLSGYIDHLRALKPVPDRVLVSAILPPAEPVVVSIDSMSKAPLLDSSCSSLNGTFGTPAPRMKQVVDAFGARGHVESICQDSYEGALSGLGARMAQAISRQCFEAELAQKGEGVMAITHPAQDAIVDPNAVDCTMQDMQAGEAIAEIPPCAPNGVTEGACFALLGDDECSRSGTRAVVCRGGFDAGNLTSPCRAAQGGRPLGATAHLRCRVIERTLRM